MARLLDPKVVAMGVLTQIAIVVPPALLVSALRRDDLGAESNLWLVAAFFALVAGPAAAGVLVARRRPDSPLLHAAAAATGGWAVLAVANLLRAVATSAEVSPLLANLLTIAPIQVGVGVLGAFFSRPRSLPEDRPVTASSEPDL